MPNDTPLDRGPHPSQDCGCRYASRAIAGLEAKNNSVVPENIGPATAPHLPRVDSNTIGDVTTKNMLTERTTPHCATALST